MAARVIDLTAPLAPNAYVFHLDGRDVDAPSWLDQAYRALDELCTRVDDPRQLALENLENYASTSQMLRRNSHSHDIFDVVSRQYVSSGKIMQAYTIKNVVPVAQHSLDIRDGDVILSINGRSIYDMSTHHVESALGGAVGSLTSLMCMRGEQRYAVSWVRGDVFSSTDDDNRCSDDSSLRERDAHVSQAASDTRTMQGSGHPDKSVSVSMAASHAASHA
jgi:hypothetical protein